jgi:DNA replicative helicase MCM subunit Mcm2 (Cdc46/Mcm family)
VDRIRTMCQNNQESLLVSYRDLCGHSPVLAMFVADAPTEVLAVFDRAAKEVVLEFYPDYENIKVGVCVVFVWFLCGFCVVFFGLTVFLRPDSPKSTCASWTILCATRSAAFVRST